MLCSTVMSDEEEDPREWSKQKIILGLAQRDVEAFYSILWQKEKYNVGEELDINILKYLLIHGEDYMREHAAESLGEDYSHRKDLIDTFIHFSQREDDEDVLRELVSALFWSFRVNEDITSMRAILDVFRKGGTKLKQIILDKLIWHMEYEHYSLQDACEFLMNCLRITTDENVKKIITDAIEKMKFEPSLLVKQFEMFFNEQGNKDGLTPKYSQSKINQLTDRLELNISDSVLTGCQLHFNIGK